MAYNRVDLSPSAGVSEAEPDDQNPLHAYGLRTRTLSEFNFSRVNQRGVRGAMFDANALPPVPDWQKAAGGKMAFDVASVTRKTTARPYPIGSNFPLGPGDVYVPNGGLFKAANLPLTAYIGFAYKVTENQEEALLSQLPKWAITDRFDIQGRAQGNPTKDQMRLMMQSLLADRFRLAVHYESRQVPVFALIVDQPGKLGPLLQKHADDSPCPTTTTPHQRSRHSFSTSGSRPPAAEF